MAALHASSLIPLCRSNTFDHFLVSPAAPVAGSCAPRRAQRTGLGHNRSGKGHSPLINNQWVLFCACPTISEYGASPLRHQPRARTFHLLRLHQQPTARYLSHHLPMRTEHPRCALDRVLAMLALPPDVSEWLRLSSPIQRRPRPGAQPMTRRSARRSGRGQRGSQRARAGVAKSRGPCTPRASTCGIGFTSSVRPASRLSSQ